MLEVKNEGPARDLVLAVNHFISNGDHLGEGVMLGILGGEKLQSCLAEIRATKIPFGFELVLERHGRYRVMMLDFIEDDGRRLARELVKQPSRAGWGSMKAVIEEHAPEVTAKLLSWEGV